MRRSRLLSDGAWAVVMFVLTVLSIGCDMESTGTSPVVEAPQQPALPPGVQQENSTAVASAEKEARAGEGPSSERLDQRRTDREREASIPAEQAGQPVPPTRGQGQSSASGGLRNDYVHLSAGVAMPQALPTGTAIALSVDYEVRRALPTNATQVLWVIETGRSRQVDVPVQLDQPNGNLMAFVRQLKPEDGPFRCHMEVVLSGGNRQRISPLLIMK